MRTSQLGGQSDHCQLGNGAYGHLGEEVAKPWQLCDGGSVLGGQDDQLSSFVLISGNA